MFYRNPFGQEFCSTVFGCNLCCFAFSQFVAELINKQKNNETSIKGCKLDRTGRVDIRKFFVLYGNMTITRLMPIGEKFLSKVKCVASQNTE